MPERDWIAKGVEVEMCPSDRKAAKSESFAGLATAEVVGLARLEGWPLMVESGVAVGGRWVGSEQ